MLFDRFFDGADHVEGVFEQVIVLAADDALELRMVSDRATSLPGVLVNCSATWKGWLRNFLDLARGLTTIFVFFESSSMPRMAMMSWSSFSCRMRCVATAT